MSSTTSQSTYMERAEMHEALANATSDGLARKMHLAMAAEYRRRAAAHALGDRSDATTEWIEPMQHLEQF